LFPVNNFPHVFGKHVLHLVQRGWVDSSLSYLSTYIHLCSCIPSPESAFVCGGGGTVFFCGSDTGGTYCRQTQFGLLSSENRHTS
jgi:hypothetical protein